MHEKDLLQPNNSTIHDFISSIIIIIFEENKFYDVREYVRFMQQGKKLVL